MLKFNFDIKSIFTKIIGLLFTFFIFLSIVLSIYYNQSRKAFSLFGNDIIWILFVISCLALSFVIFLVITKISNHTKILDYELLVVISIFTLTFTARFICISLLDVIPKNDFALYYNLAEQFSKNNFVGKSYISMFPHTFGYPFILSLFFKIFGTQIIAAQVINIITESGIAIVLYYLGKHLFNSKAGFLSGLIYAFWPSHILYSVLVSTEGIFTLLFLVSLLLFFRISNIEKIKLSIINFIILGAICAILNSIRPLGILVISVYSLVYLINWKIASMKIHLQKLLPVIAFLLSYFIIFNFISIGISKIILKEVAKSPIGFNLYVGSNIKYSGRWNAEDSKVLENQMGNGKFDAQKVHYKLTILAIERYKSQGWLNIKLFAQKFLVMWASDDDILSYIKAGLTGDKILTIKYNTLYRYLGIICNLYYIITLFLCIISLFSIRKNMNNKFVTIILLILGIAFIHLVMEVHGRYHYPAIPLLTVLAGYGAYEINRINFLWKRKIIKE